jgi:hypothetical protein
MSGTMSASIEDEIEQHGVINGVYTNNGFRDGRKDKSSGFYGAGINER